MGDVVQVQANATQSLRGFENEDVAAAVLKFKSGAVATITVSDAIVAPWSWELTAGENPAYPQTSQRKLSGNWRQRRFAVHSRFNDLVEPWCKELVEPYRGKVCTA